MADWNMLTLEMANGRWPFRKCFGWYLAGTTDATLSQLTIVEERWTDGQIERCPDDNVGFMHVLQQCKTFLEIFLTSIHHQFQI